MPAGQGSPAGEGKTGGAAARDRECHQQRAAKPRPLAIGARACAAAPNVGVVARRHPTSTGATLIGYWFPRACFRQRRWIDAGWVSSTGRAMGLRWQNRGMSRLLKSELTRDFGRIAPFSDAVVVAMTALVLLLLTSRSTRPAAGRSSSIGYGNQIGAFFYFYGFFVIAVYWRCTTESGVPLKGPRSCCSG